MKKFEELTYQRPDMEQFSRDFNAMLDRFEQADSLEEQSNLLNEINQLRLTFSSMYNLCHIRHTVDTRDAQYEAENTFFDENNPGFEALNNRFYELLLASPFRKELEAKWGDQLFVLAELSIKTFKPEILENLQEENRLVSEYIKLKASAKIPFKGVEYNLSTLFVVETDPDRDTRRAASEAKWKFFSDHAAKTEHIFDQQVAVRHEMAKALGYRNFVEMAYARMCRSDYDAEKVAIFRKQIETHIVPIATSFYERQRKRLGLEKLKYYDEEFRYVSGNPKPKGTPEWIIEQADTMYQELSADTEVFFRFMQDNHLMNLVAQEGKATGGYCTFIGEYKAPFIFSNFNGTSADIDVLTHEAGHAFQMYLSRDHQLTEYNFPTYEACEIHSMSMEFFTWPWMHLFFGPDADKYKFAHLAAAIQFLPYGVAVDEFQHFVYENPEVTPADRNAAWREIEKKYLPHRDYDGNAFLESGGFWQKQSHIFANPFYYIDYTLAQICAFQFWKKDREDHNAAWQDYIRLCKAGGSLPFLELVRLANLRSPFEEGCVSSVTGVIRDWLEEVDDSGF